MTSPRIGCVYRGVLFDMDGTLTISHIPFDEMRSRTGIPMGDLFTVMEAWQDASKVKAAMDVILEIEARATKTVAPQPGLLELLEWLKEREVKVALVTRNTTESVNAFFDLIGQEWRSCFDVVLTREFPYVKPDKRLLLHIAEAWAVDPSLLLMVGDSFEDVECGNAAGTATCLLAGGGNEKPGANMGPPPGAVPTFAVSGLAELQQRLEDADAQVPWVERDGRLVAWHDMHDNNSTACSLLADGTLSMVSSLDDDTHNATSPASASGQDLPGSPALAATSAAAAALFSNVKLGWPAREAAGEVVTSSGAPPPGLAFLDWLDSKGALAASQCSFPRMGAAAGGLATCEPGDRVLHLGCGAGALTKLMASTGMQVVGVDVDVSVAQRRGLQAVPYAGRPLTGNSLRHVQAHGPFDVVLLHGRVHSDTAPPTAAEVTSGAWWQPGALHEVRSVLGPEGRLCTEVPLRSGTNPAAIINSIHDSGFTVVAWQLVTPRPSELQGLHPSTCGGKHLRIVARVHTQ